MSGVDSTQRIHTSVNVSAGLYMRHTNEMLGTRRSVEPGVPQCQEPLAKQRQQALTPVRMADVHTSRQGGTWGHGTGQGWLLETVPSGYDRKQTEAFLSRAAGCIHHQFTSHKLRSTLKAYLFYYELILVVIRWRVWCVFLQFSLPVRSFWCSEKLLCH
ncbi:hypothetical protein XENOCAPTIV_030456 [Xenoophorus captivus]|uniref:Uncharacterized protein n=1 Tax=Xenoophorus captivus TaxID=1517983 RepID=A0ABV0QG35_9TELE